MTDGYYSVEFAGTGWIAFTEEKATYFRKFLEARGRDVEVRYVTND